MKGECGHGARGDGVGDGGRGRDGGKRAEETGDEVADVQAGIDQEFRFRSNITYKLLIEIWVDKSKEFKIS